MNGDTQAIYEKKQGSDVAMKLNTMMKEIVTEQGAKFIDLHKAFENDFKVHQKKFEFKTDGHWSPYGQKVATRPIYESVKTILKDVISAKSKQRLVLYFPSVTYCRCQIRHDSHP